MNCKTSCTQGIEYAQTMLFCPTRKQFMIYSKCRPVVFGSRNIRLIARFETMENTWNR